jgi:hypothetical protein
MSQKILIIVLFSLFILFMVASNILYKRKDIFDGINNSKDCYDKSKLPKSCQNDKNCCSVWDDKNKVCARGKISGMTCESEGNVYTLFLLILGGLCLIAGIFYSIKLYNS